MNNLKEFNLLLLTDPQGGPPGTDPYYPEKWTLGAQLLDAVKLSIAISLAWGIMFLLISLIVWISGNGTVLDFFKLIYPGFNPTLFLGIIIGFAWSVLYGFIFGIVIGIIYNSLVRTKVVNGESWETFS